MPADDDAAGSGKTGGLTRVTTIVSADIIQALDAWIADRPDPKPSRPDAIRRCLAEWLAFYRLDKNAAGVFGSRLRHK